MSGDEAPAKPKPTTTMPQPPLPVLPIVLLGLMTLATFVGPFLIYVSVRGGVSPEWPPDRPVEWWVFGGVTCAVALLMAACVTVGLWSRGPTSAKGRSR